jgi:hypothetical protein
MADVTQKIISGNAQPNEGRIVMQPMVGNPQGFQTLNPPVNRGTSVSTFETKLTNRFDRPRYYYSTPSGLQY